MASPFRIFRKHQKAMFAVLGVMVMIAFVFLPSIMPTQRGTRDEVYVRTAKFGELRGSQIRTLLNQRQHILGFLQSLGMELARSGGNYRFVEQVRTLIGPATEQSVAERWLFAREAERLGVVVDDASINLFLKELTENRVSASDMAKILRQPKSAISESQLFAMLREELLALRFRELFLQLHSTGAALSIPPGQRWDYYKRLNQRAAIEAAALPVADYVNQVKSPDEATLKTFFEKYKEAAARPESPDPGFREPRRLNVQYLKAEHAKFLATVTDADVKQHYEKNKERYDKEADREEAAEKSVEPEKKAEPAKTAQPEKKTEPEKKTQEKGPAEDSGLKKEESKDATKPKEAEKPAPTKPDHHSAAPTRSPFRFVSFSKDPSADDDDEFADEKDKPADEKKPEAKKPADEKKPEAKKPAEEKKPEAKKSADEKKPETKKPADEKKPEVKKPADEKNPAEEKKPEAKKPETPAVSAKPAEPPVAAKPKAPRERPSAQTLRRIREELTEEKVTTALSSAKESLAKYRVLWTRYDAERQRNTGATMPPPPDFVELAKRYKLVAAKTGLISATDFDAARSDIGESYLRVNAAGPMGFRSVPFLQYVFETGRILYQAELSSDHEGNQFLFWKTDEFEDRVPSYDDEGVADRVLQAWKMIEARKLALDAAASLKEEAAKARRPLKEVLSDRPNLRVIPPLPFSWLTFGNLPIEELYSGQMPRPRLSPGDGITAPGNLVGTEFMRAVFDLSPGQL